MHKNKKCLFKTKFESNLDNLKKCTMPFAKLDYLVQFDSCEKKRLLNGNNRTIVKNVCGSKTEIPVSEQFSKLKNMFCHHKMSYIISSSRL